MQSKAAGHAPNAAAGRATSTSSNTFSFQTQHTDQHSAVPWHSRLISSAAQQTTKPPLSSLAYQLAGHIVQLEQRVDVLSAIGRRQVVHQTPLLLLLLTLLILLVLIVTTITCTLLLLLPPITSFTTSSCCSSSPDARQCCCCWVPASSQCCEQPSCCSSQVVIIVLC